MKYLLIALLFIMGCNKECSCPMPEQKQTTVRSKGFKVGDCIHLRKDIFKVKVIGNHSYGLQWQTAEKEKSKKTMFVLPIDDTNDQAVVTDCYDTMLKEFKARL